jgi:hypothetical protein
MCCVHVCAVAGTVTVGGNLLQIVALVVAERSSADAALSKQTSDIQHTHNKQTMCCYLARTGLRL